MGAATSSPISIPPAKQKAPGGCSAPQRANCCAGPAILAAGQTAPTIVIRDVSHKLNVNSTADNDAVGACADNSTVKTAPDHFDFLGSGGQGHYAKYSPELYPHRESERGVNLIPGNPVGTTAATSSLQLIFTTAGTLNTIQALTFGAPSLDFAVTSEGTCAIGTT